jgi:hypothetical protein
MSHRCAWTIRRWRQDDDTPELSIQCGGSDGCGATSAACGVPSILALLAWLRANGYTSG